MILVKMCEPGKEFTIEDIKCLCNDNGTRAECSSGDESFNMKTFDIKNRKFSICYVI